MSSCNGTSTKSKLITIFPVSKLRKFSHVLTKISWKDLFSQKNYYIWFHEFFFFFESVRKFFVFPQCDLVIKLESWYKIDFLLKNPLFTSERDEKLSSVLVSFAIAALIIMQSQCEKIEKFSHTCEKFRENSWQM